MSNAVNNVNIDDGTKVLSRSAGGDVDFTYAAFSAANAALTGRPTLFFRVKPRPGAGGITLDVSLNGTSVFSTSFDTTQLRSLHEIVDNNILQVANNVLVIEATAGAGSIDVSDVLLYYPTTV